MGSAINGVKWTSLSAVVNACAKLGQISILTRFLRKEDFGLIAIAVLVISFTEIFMDGVFHLQYSINRIYQKMNIVHCIGLILYLDL